MTTKQKIGTVYYLLLVRETIDSPWSCQFGDYSKRTVREERDEYANRYPRYNLRTVQSFDSQSAIDETVARVNSESSTDSEDDQLLRAW